MDNFVLQKQTAEIWSTDSVHINERFDFWQDVVCRQICRLECERHVDTPFSGELRYARFGPLDFIEMRSEPLIFSRTTSHIREMTSQTMVLSLPLTSQSKKALNLRELSTQRGDVSCYDATRPQKLMINSQISALILQLPKELLGNYLLNIEDYDSTVISTRTLVGQMASDMILSLASHLGKGNNQKNDLAITALLQLIAYAMTESKGESANEDRHALIKVCLKQSIQKFIDANFHCRELTPSLIAERFKISSRYLHRLFEDEQHSVAKTIISTRLGNAMRILASEKHSIKQVAFRCGFKDVSHFSRTFKKRYALNPKDVQPISNSLR